MSHLENKLEKAEKELAETKEKATKEKQELEIKVAKLEATQGMGAHIFNAFVGGLGRTSNLAHPMATPTTSFSASASTSLPPGYSLSPAGGFAIEPMDP